MKREGWERRSRGRGGGGEEGDTDCLDAGQSAEGERDVGCLMS